MKRNQHSSSLPLKQDAQLRAKIELSIDRLLNLLDEIDGDPDLEPSLGWPDPFSWWRFSDEMGGCNDVEACDGS